MIGTREEAATWVCHKTRATGDKPCLGPGCSAWRWLTDEFEIVKTGTYVRHIDGQPAKPPTVVAPQGDGWEPMGHMEQHPDLVERGGRPFLEFFRYWKRPRDPFARLGYCGAVGSP